MSPPRARRFPPFTARAALGLVCALAPLFPPASPARPIARQARADAGDPARWVEELGASEPARRDEAEKKLRESGAAARAAIRRAVFSDDPEIRLRAERLWEELRWQVVPDMPEDELAGLQKSFGEPETRQRWQTSIARHGAALFPLIVEIANSAGGQDAARRALEMLLEAVPSREVGRVIADGPAEGRNIDAVIDLFRTASEGDLGRAAWLRAVEVELLLWRYAEAFETARRGWMRHRDDGMVEAAATAVRRGELGDLPWAPVEAKGEEEARARLLFMVRLAQRLAAADKLKEKLSLESPDTWAASDVYDLCETLNALGLASETVRILSRAESPRLLYLRSRARGAAGDREASASDRTEALRRLREMDGPTAEEALFEAGEIMDRAGDSSAEELWRRMLEIAPHDSIYDANAMLRLARRREARGAWAEAADLFEKALQISIKTGGALVLSATPGVDAAGGLDWLRRHVRDLRRRDAEP